MADDVGDKTEPPTPRRRTEARSSGQVAKSQDLSASVLLFVSLMGLKLFGGNLWDALQVAMGGALGSDGPPSIDTTLTFSSRMLGEVVKAVLPFFIALLIAGYAVLYAQVGWLITFQPLKPKFSKLNPLNGAKRIFSTNTVIQLFQNVAKLGLVGLVAWLSVRTIIDKIAVTHTVDFAVTLFMACSLVFHVGIRLAITLLVLAILDYFYQRYRHEKQLKMTKEEVKEEAKRMEGDPMIKKRRREVQLRLAMERLKSSVPKADVVVTNPTHYAVALRYAPDEMAAPEVIAKGVDHMARRIRELAVAAAVPIVQKPELARMLYADVEVGHQIPERLYRAVAEILAYVYELSGRHAQRPVSAG